MRSIWITSLCLASFACTGCGSDSDAPSSGESTKPVGVPLSIRHPKTDAKDLQARTEEHRAAVDALVDKATQAVSARRGDLAIEALSQAIGIDPSDPRLLRMRADIYAMSGELASARAALPFLPTRPTPNCETSADTS
jgi:Flp pilus assembly protein TadD